jgi:hypothetical protein
VSSEQLWAGLRRGGKVRTVKVAPYYSISPEDREVYHDKSNCPDGERIKPGNKRSGTGNRPYCKECPKVA